MDKNKEQVYDELINPLMARIIEICKEHRIAMLASFSIPTADDADLCCTSCLLDDEYGAPRHFFRAKAALFSGRVFTITTKDGDGNIIASEVILATDGRVEQQTGSRENRGHQAGPE
jgi:hypothetical protein